MEGLGDKDRLLLLDARRHDVARHGVNAPGLDVEPLEIHDRCGLGGALVHVGRAGEVGDLQAPTEVEGQALQPKPWKGRLKGRE